MVSARTRTQKLGEPEEYGDKARSGFAVSGGPHCAKFPTLSSGMLAANVPGSPCRRFGGCLRTLLQVLNASMSACQGRGLFQFGLTSAVSGRASQGVLSEGLTHVFRI